MTDYIKREDIVNLAVTMQTHLWTREQTYNAIFCLPTADVEPVRHAEWIKKEYWSEGVGMGEDWGHYYECSACGERIKGYDTHLDKYCRKCGAKMKRAQTDEGLVYYDHEPKTENCNTCKNYALCGTTFGCRKKYEDHCICGWYIAWPYSAWCEDWEAKDNE